MTIKVVIIGQGYVGLPIAMAAVEAGFDVVGLDNDERRTARLGAADSFVEDVSSAELASAIASGRYKATTNYAEAEGFDVAVITVPTPLRETLPDLSFIEGAALSLASSIRSGCLVVLESTTYPGTTDELLVPILESGSGLKAGVDFHVGYSPERIDPGNPVWGFKNTPKVIAGVNASSLAAVADFYSALVDRVVPVKSCKEAELTKLLENTFRHVNVALVNELAVFAHELDIDVWDAIEAAATKPFGYMKFTPGPGVGGHCLPIDPSYLSWRVKQTLGRPFRFVELANDVNEHMPDHVVTRLTLLLNDRSKPVRGSRLLLVGLSYKKNSSDARESPAVRVAEILVALGADVTAIDPHLAELPRQLTKVELIAHTEVNFSSYDAVVVLTDHDAIDYGAVRDDAVLVLDTRHRLEAGDHVEFL
jgi:UDP-N-acetyl-D-mannosaminuronic acid dehydrogenase/UDP-N-acetyl-D-glucosamine dehydrogenase